MRGNDFLSYADAQFAASANIPADWKEKADLRDAYRAGCLSEVCASMFRFLPDEEKARFAYVREATDA